MPISISINNQADKADVRFGTVFRVISCGRTMPYDYSVVTVSTRSGSWF